ncbi:MAG: preprotein translocase subunit SecA [Candidatus Niyogibacteria bacterium]|nr:preprotein translocase subunit SecA [Candidatus Niyogibacteria bacterium]
MSIFSKIFGSSEARLLRKFSPEIRAIGEKEAALKELSAGDFPVKTAELKARLASGRAPNDVLVDAFALAREASRRTLGQRHYDVQLLGGILLNQGAIAEMRTGEGKTLVATLPAYLNALTGNGVHIVTVNDYLARRDTVWMGQIYHALGLSVGCITHDASFLYDPAHVSSPVSDDIRDTEGGFRIVHEFLRPCARREAYAADITYGTNNEFGFDYLRDNLAYRAEDRVQRAHHFAIVDEVDSILIDEARTPLIISAPDAESSKLYQTFARIAEGLQDARDFTVDEKLHAVSLTDDGITRAEKALGISNLYGEGGIKLVHHLEQAIRAKALYRRDKDYVVKNSEVIIVDEFTGRLMPGRRWSEGLHQAVEAKEGVGIQQESRTVASITFQNYFRLYEKLSGMTGTAATSAEEFHKVYNLEVFAIPTNRPLIRRDHSDHVLQTERAKWKAVVEEIRERNSRNQPVLVGTVSIEKNELLSDLLKRAGIAHRMLNAKNHEEEAKIIAQAGRAGAVTVATNMAGRGVDIILGGNPSSPEETRGVVEAGGLFVLGTDRHEARRIDNQLRGRAGRQGDPGETQFFVSFDDDLLRIFGAEKMKTMMKALKIPEDESVENSMVSRAIESAQSKVEGFSFDTRKHLLEYDDVMNKHRQVIYRRRNETLTRDDGDIIAEMRGMLDDPTREKFDAREKGLGSRDFARVLRAAWLQTIDHFWMEHLEVMEYMRSSVRLRAYGQRDPLVEYKNEGARLFHELEDVIDAHVKDLALRAVNAPKPEFGAMKPVHAAPAAPTPQGAGIGRNDPCPCGSGKKYKKCHGA